MNREKPILMMVDGVGALGLMPFTMPLAVRATGDRYEIRHFVWTHGVGRMLADLRDRQHIIQKGTALAQSINSLISEPRQLVMVAKSGGTAVALEALAQLAPESVERVVLLSPAVSPDFDLSPAIKAVRTKMYSYYSPLDGFMLGWGTSIFGTADGIKTNAAGYVGFKNLDRYDKFEQFCWTREMCKSWNFGTHVGTSMHPFLTHYVLPLLA